MPWYTASIIISCRLKHGHQKVYPVYENFTLFEAENRSDAIKKAESYGKRYAEVDDQLQLNGEEAYWKFEGIRKLIEIRNYFSDELDIDGPRSKVELSYSYMEVNALPISAPPARARRFWLTAKCSRSTGRTTPMRRRWRRGR